MVRLDVKGTPRIQAGQRQRRTLLSPVSRPRMMPATATTGCRARWRPILGWRRPERSSSAGVCSAPADATTARARKRRVWVEAGGGRVGPTGGWGRGAAACCDGWARWGRGSEVVCMGEMRYGGGLGHTWSALWVMMRCMGCLGV